MVKGPGRGTWSRAGSVRLGCVFIMVLAGVGIYYGTPIGQMYWRYFQFRDAFRQEAKFATQHDDYEIKRTLRDMADSLQLPDQAKKIFVKRKEHHITIWDEYYEHIDLQFFSRDFYFNPQAEADF